MPSLQTQSPYLALHPILGPLGPAVRASPDTSRGRAGLLDAPPAAGCPSPAPVGRDTRLPEVRPGTPQDSTGSEERQHDPSAHPSAPPSFRNDPPDLGQLPIVRPFQLIVHDSDESWRSEPSRPNGYYEIRDLAWASLEVVEEEDSSPLSAYERRKMLVLQDALAKFIEHKLESAGVGTTAPAGQGGLVSAERPGLSKKPKNGFPDPTSQPARRRSRILAPTAVEDGGFENAPPLRTSMDARGCNSEFKREAAGLAESIARCEGEMVDLLEAVDGLEQQQEVVRRSHRSRSHSREESRTKSSSGRTGDAQCWGRAHGRAGGSTSDNDDFRPAQEQQSPLLHHEEDLGVFALEDAKKLDDPSPTTSDQQGSPVKRRYLYNERWRRENPFRQERKRVELEELREKYFGRWRRSESGHHLLDPQTHQWMDTDTGILIPREAASPPKNRKTDTGILVPDQPDEEDPFPPSPERRERGAATQSSINTLRASLRAHASQNPQLLTSQDLLAMLTAESTEAAEFLGALVEEHDRIQKTAPLSTTRSRRGLGPLRSSKIRTSSGDQEDQSVLGKSIFEEFPLSEEEQDFGNQKTRRGGGAGGLPTPKVTGRLRGSTDRRRNSRDQVTAAWEEKASLLHGHRQSTKQQESTRRTSPAPQEAKDRRSGAGVVDRRSGQRQRDVSDARGSGSGSSSSKNGLLPRTDEVLPGGRVHGSRRAASSAVRPAVERARKSPGAPRSARQQDASMQSGSKTAKESFRRVVGGRVSHSTRVKLPSEKLQGQMASAFRLLQDTAFLLTEEGKG